MDFRQRAQNALERDDPGRALMILVNGLRRKPESEEAVDLLIYTYLHHIKQPGMEGELLRGIEFQFNRGVLVWHIISELEGLDRAAMAESLLAEAEIRGVDIIGPAPPSPPAELQPTVSKSPPKSKPDDLPIAPACEPKAADISVSVTPTALSDEALRENQPSVDRKNQSIPSSTSPADPVVGQVTSKSPSTDEEPRRGRKRRALILASALLVLGVVLASGYAAWEHARLLQHLTEVDGAIMRFDPLAAQAVPEILGSDFVEGEESAELTERRLFLESLLVLEGSDHFEARPESSTSPSTSWGYGANALEATARGDWETAVHHLRHLERTDGQSLAAIYARGRLCEARGEWVCATEQYERSIEAFPEFLPAYLGTYRVAAYRFDEDLWDNTRQSLEAVDPEHPYVHLKWLDPTVRAREQGDNKVQEVAERDAFLSQWYRSYQVKARVLALDWDGALAYCGREEGKLELPTLRILCARGAAAVFDWDSATHLLGTVLSDGSAEIKIHRIVQNFGVDLLTDAGRPDLALEIAVEFDDRRTEGVAQEPVAADESSLQRVYVGAPMPSGEFNRDDAGALLARGRAWLKWGKTERARRALRPIQGRDDLGAAVDYLLLWSHLIDGDRGQARAVIEASHHEPIAYLGASAIAYLEGRHDEAYGTAPEKPEQSEALRLRVLAMVADGRGRDAARELERYVKGHHGAMFAAVRYRALGRTGEEIGDEFEGRLSDLQGVTNIDVLIDLGAAAFWQRDLETSVRLLGDAAELAPHHPEINWKLGLLHRVEGRERHAGQFFRKSWRGYEDTTYLLLETGRVHLEFGRHERARETFVRAVLRDRENVAAVAGLGRSYYQGDQARGRRDLLDLLGNYRGIPAERPARAEMKRWLAILHGSRQGNEEAWPYLERAREVGGERIPWLLEVGRYLEAREEWDEARQSYATALRMDPSSPETYLRLAKVAHAQGDEETADEYLERFWRLNPAEELRGAASRFAEALAGSAP